MDAARARVRAEIGVGDFGSDMAMDRAVGPLASRAIRAGTRSFMPAIGWKPRLATGMSRLGHCGTMIL